MFGGGLGEGSKRDRASEQGNWWDLEVAVASGGELDRVVLKADLDIRLVEPRDAQNKIISFECGEVGFDSLLPSTDLEVHG